MTGQRSTISDVASRAGVSKATVSAVLNGTGAVKPATRDRVLAAAEALNYRPQHSGPRAAAHARRDRCIALLIKEHDNPYYAAIIDGVRAVAESAGYTLLVVSTAGEYESERRAVELLRGKDVDGLIVTPVLDEHADLAHYFELRRRNVPFVLLEEVRGLPASLVDVNNVDASRRAVEHLIALGHSRIVHFAGPAYSAHSRQRVDGVRHAYSASHLVFGDGAVVPAGAHMEDGYRAAAALFGVATTGKRRDGAAPRPTAVTCYNDLVAVGVLRALREAGLRVPEDVSVVGFDDIPLCEYVDRPLTTVRVPMFEMGETAARMLLEHVEAQQAIPPKKVFVDATLVVRASTAPPPGPSSSSSLSAATAAAPPITTTTTTATTAVVARSHPSAAAGAAPAAPAARGRTPRQLSRRDP